MTLWLIGNIILLVVVFPIVLILLNRILIPVQRIRKTVDDILANGVALTGELDNVPALLATTDSTVKEISVGAARYGGSVAKLLG
ncbi:MAG: hypothetical protein JWR88_247 [Pseudonocardia sp.]|jgi:hypothetical protein|nr:hypothetical protein [Pseudonocardia sp.]